MTETIEITAQRLLGKTVLFERYISNRELTEGVVVGFSGLDSLTLLCNKGWTLKDNYTGTILTELPQDALLWHISIDEIIKIK